MMIWLLGVGFASAEESDLRVDADVDMWIAAQQVSEFSANAEGVKGGQGGHLLGRQIIGAVVRAEPIQAKVGVSVTEHHIAGSTSQVPGTIDERNRFEHGSTQFQVRQLSVASTFPVAQVETGLVTSQWGLGMLANDGRHDPYFGHPEFGDRVIRARITTQPIPDGHWFITGAVDQVVQDEQVVDPRRQWAQQGVLSALWRSEDNEAGLYGVARRQEELDVNRITKIGVLDGYVDLTARWRDDWSLRFAAEVATISGKTNRTTSYESPTRLRIQSMGGTGVSMITWRSVSAGTAFGYASGDGDPADDVLNDFTFDRNHNVGMILFDELGGSVEAATYLDLVNPEYAGSPPDGVEATVTEGSFRRGSYIQPRIEFDPAPWLHLRTGAVLAWATAPISQPFYTTRNGGVPVNQLKQQTEGYRIGTELDWAIRISPSVDNLREKMGFAPSLSIQGGTAWVHPNLGGETIDKYLLLLRVH